MYIYINEEKKEVPERTSVNELITILQLSEKRGIAIAVNNTVVSKNNWANYFLKENDKLLIIKATQGG